MTVPLDVRAYRLEQRFAQVARLFEDTRSTDGPYLPPVVEQLAKELCELASLVKELAEQSERGR